MTGFVRARIDEKLKLEATIVLDSVGLTVSDAVRMLLTRIAREKALPIELVTPNEKTVAAMEEGRRVIDARKARFVNSEEMFRELDHETDETETGRTSKNV